MKKLKSKYLRADAGGSSCCLKLFFWQTEFSPANSSIVWGAIVDSTLWSLAAGLGRLVTANQTLNLTISKIGDSNLRVKSPKETEFSR